MKTGTAIESGINISQTIAQDIVDTLLNKSGGDKNAALKEIDATLAKMTAANANRWHWEKARGLLQVAELIEIAKMAFESYSAGMPINGAKAFVAARRRLDEIAGS